MIEDLQLESLALSEQQEVENESRCPSPTDHEFRHDVVGQVCCCTKWMITHVFPGGDCIDAVNIDQTDHIHMSKAPALEPCWHRRIRGGGL